MPNSTKTKAPAGGAAEAFKAQTELDQGKSVMDATPQPALVQTTIAISCEHTWVPVLLHEGSHQERLAGVFKTAREAAMAAAAIIRWRPDAIGFSACRLGGAA